MLVIRTQNDLEKMKIEARPGFYLLCLDRALPKIKAVDDKGIVYIGKSTNLSIRLMTGVKEPWRVKLDKLSPFMFDHSALTFAVDIDANGELVPSRNLVNGGLLSNSDKFVLYVFYCEEEKIREKQLLNAHVAKYGQLPPFNSQGSSLKATGESEISLLDAAIGYYDEVCRKI